MAENIVKVNEVTRVTPLADPSSTKTAPFTLPLTYLDIYWFKVLPVERLFFYQITDLTRDFFDSVILPKLKHSLSLTLLHYLPLAGNIMWPEGTQKPAVYFFPDNDDGVSVTVAESSSDSTDLFSLLSGNGIRKAVEFHPLVPNLPISDDKAEIIAVQITLFLKEGYSIGITSHHAVLDGKSSTLFVKSWAYLCKHLQQNPTCLPPELTPFLDRNVIKDPEGRDMVELNNWFDHKQSLKVLPFAVSVDLSKLVRATFKLSREDIKKLRDKVNEIVTASDVKKSRQLHLSNFVLTLAYVFVCMFKAKTGKAQGNRNALVGFTADYRTRLDPPVPDNYFGNCNGIHGAVTEASEVKQENGVAFAAEMISDLIKGIDANVADEGSDVKIAKIVEHSKQGAFMLSVAGSTRFDVYGSDFGWGRPRKVEIVSIDRTGAVSFAESKDGGGGVEVGVVLEEKEMEVFASLFTNGPKK